MHANIHDGSVSDMSSLLPELVLLDHLDGRVQDRVEDPGNGENPPDDGARSGQEVVPGLGRVADDDLGERERERERVIVMQPVVPAST